MNPPNGINAPMPEKGAWSHHWIIENPRQIIVAKNPVTKKDVDIFDVIYFFFWKWIKIMVELVLNSSLRGLNQFFKLVIGRHLQNAYVWQKIEMNYHEWIHN